MNELLAPWICFALRWAREPSVRLLQPVDVPPSAPREPLDAVTEPRAELNWGHVVDCLELFHLLRALDAACWRSLVGSLRRGAGGADHLLVQDRLLDLTHLPMRVARGRFPDWVYRRVLGLARDDDASEMAFHRVRESLLRRLQAERRTLVTELRVRIALRHHADSGPIDAAMAAFVALVRDQQQRQQRRRCHDVFRWTVSSWISMQPRCRRRC
ncbi:hypothetical protein PINS_up009337 [Pythium insidiosum]|nr:hypothetical protein PINS_up009337 [Pythium insidiosum]